MKRTLALSAAAILASASALAYVPPSFYIVRQITRKHVDLKGVTIKSRVTFLDGSSAPRGVPLTETLSIGEGKASIVLKNPEGTIVASATRELEGRPERLSTLYALSVLSNSSEAYNMLKAAGLPLKTEAQLYAEKDPRNEALPYAAEETVTFARQGNRPALVINGDRGKSQAPPQLWVDKGSLLPLKWLYRNDSGSLVEVRFGNHAVWKSSLYPRTMDILVGGEPWCRIELLEFKEGKGEGTAGNRVAEAAGSLSSELESYLKWIR